LSKVDITLSIIILVGAYNGFRDGFRVELFSAIAVFLGVLLGFKLMGTMMVMLEEEHYIDEFALPYLAFGVVFFVVVLIVNLLAKLIMKRYPEPVLGLADPYAGGVIGLFRTAFMMSLVLLILDALKITFPDDWTQDSWLWQKVAHFAPDTLRALGGSIPFFSDII
jgi:membrane protein required for colicin V production